MTIPKPVIEPLLTPAEVAGLFRVDAKTVTRWHKAGRFPDGVVILTLGGHRRYKEAEIRAMLRGEQPRAGAA